MDPLAARGPPVPVSDFAAYYRELTQKYCPGNVQVTSSLAYPSKEVDVRTPEELEQAAWEANKNCVDLDFPQRPLPGSKC